MNEYDYDELNIGMEESFKKVISEEDLELFSKITGDKNPLHMNEDYAKTTKFKKRVVHGQLVNSLLSTLAGMYLPGKKSLILSIKTYFKKPAFINDELLVSGRIKKKTDSIRVIELETRIMNSKGEVIQEGEMIIRIE